MIKRLLLILLLASTVFGGYSFRGPLSDSTSDFLVTAGFITGATNTNWDDAYNKRVDTWTFPLQFSSNVASISLTDSGIDHGGLAGLGDDDHSQYFADTTIGTRTASYATTGIGTFGSLITGGNIGVSGDTDIIQLATNLVTVNGDVVLPSGSNGFFLGASVDPDYSVRVTSEQTAAQSGDAYSARFIKTFNYSTMASASVRAGVGSTLQDSRTVINTNPFSGIGSETSFGLFGTALQTSSFVADGEMGTSSVHEYTGLDFGSILRGTYKETLNTAKPSAPNICIIGSKVRPELNVTFNKPAGDAYFWCKTIGYKVESSHVPVLTSVDEVVHDEYGIFLDLDHSSEPAGVISTSYGIFNNRSSGADTEYFLYDAHSVPSVHSGNARFGDTTAPTHALEVAGLTKTEGGRIVNDTLIDNTDSPYTALSSDHEIFVDTDTTAVTINLPAGIAGTNYRIINTGSSGNDITIAPNGAELLTGANASKTASDGTVIILTYNATKGWY